MPNQLTPTEPFYSVKGEALLFLDWCRRNPVDTLLLFLSLATLMFFYGYLPLCAGHHSIAIWAWQAWNPQENQEHAKLVLPIALGLVFYHYDALKKATKSGALRGLIFLGIGIGIFVLAARCLQPRLSLMSVPFVIYGTVYYLWGRQVARIILFPCAFLIFMVPSAVIEQITFRLQFIITGVVGAISSLIGIHVQAVGTTLSAADGSYHFDIVGGCSGIRSLIAMTMLTAAYVHLTQDKLWKKIAIFCASILFALVGNIGRVLSIILAARFLDPKFPNLIPKFTLFLAKFLGNGVLVEKDLPSNFVHEWSGFVFFPIALLAMLGFSKIVNWNVKSSAAVAAVTGSAGKAAQDEVSYDY